MSKTIRKFSDNKKNVRNEKQIKTFESKKAFPTKRVKRYYE